jgi:hypothetical protein
MVEEAEKEHAVQHKLVAGGSSTFNREILAYFYRAWGSLGLTLPFPPSLTPLSATLDAVVLTPHFRPSPPLLPMQATSSPSSKCPSGWLTEMVSPPRP